MAKNPSAGLSHQTLKRLISTLRASPDLKTCFQNFGQNNENRGGGRPDLVNMFSGKKRPPANMQDGCIRAGKQSRIVWLSRPWRLRVILDITQNQMSILKLVVWLVNCNSAEAHWLQKYAEQSQMPGSPQLRYVALVCGIPGLVSLLMCTVKLYF